VDDAVVFVVARDVAVRRAVARLLWRAIGVHPVRPSAAELGLGSGRLAGAGAVVPGGGSPAIARASAAHPSLIVIDVSEADRRAGLALIRSVKRHPATRGVPVVATGDGPEAREGARSAGCDGFFARSCSADDVRELLRAWVPLNSGRRGCALSHPPAAPRHVVKELRE
jgi:CheY-like chemotaxis protein